MKILYRNNQVERLCKSTDKATKKFGKEIALKLAGLLDAIEAFPSLKDVCGLPQYRLHPLKGNRRNQYSFVISKASKWRLVIYPLDEEEKLLISSENEKEMLTKAVVVEVLEVSDHYD